MDSRLGDILTCDDLSFNKELTIAYWNIRSAYPKFEDLLHCINASEVEIFYVGETWLNNFILDSMMEIEGYRRDRDKNSNKTREGGLMVYVKNKLDAVV